jgi:ABC-2 type transport system permease protein
MSKFLAILIFDTKRNSLLISIWTIVWALLAFSFSTFYSSVEDTEDFAELLEAFPEELLTAFASDPETFTTVAGFFNTEFTVLYLLSIGILAGYLGVAAIAKEIENSSILFLLSKPVSRISIYLSKLVANYLLLLVANAVIILSAVLGFLLIEVEVPYQYFTSLYVVLSVYSLFFLTLGKLLGILLSENRALGLSVLTALVAFFVNAIQSIGGVPDFLKYLTPYYYLGLRQLVAEMTVKTPEVFTLLVVSLVLVISGCIYFRQKNIDTL